MQITRELEMLLADVDTNWGGRARIEEFYCYRLERGPRVAAHAITDFRTIPQSPTSAISTWYLILYAHDGEPVQPTAPPIQIVLAIDHCVKCSDGRWRYKYRKFEVWFKGGVSTTTLRD